MGDSCCQSKAKALEQLRQRQRSVLWTVLGINLVMFGVELVAGLKAQSLSLTGDSLDMLGDALVYGSSLYVLSRSVRAQAKAALFKGSLMFLTAVVVLGRAIYQLATQTTPTVAVMGGIGLLALGANLVCLLLLTRHKDDNLNLSSVWLCSRNDIIANTSVLVAAGLVWLSGSFIPDLMVGLLITVVFARSAGNVLTRAWRDLQRV